MILYIIRHGDPDYENDTLTPYGHEEAAALAEWFAHIPLDRIYTSPLGRARDTAAYTAKVKGITPIILPWAEESMDYMRPFSPDDHCEYRFSTTTGVSAFQDYYADDRSPTLDRLVNRADAWLSELGYTREGAHYRVRRNNEERVALFCHGGFGTALTAHLLGMPPALGFSSMFMTTTSVTTFELRSGAHDWLRPRMLRFGEVSHLHAKGIAGER